MGIVTMHRGNSPTDRMDATAQRTTAMGWLVSFLTNTEDSRAQTPLARIAPPSRYREALSSSTFKFSRADA